MLRTLVIDDEPLAVELVSAYVNKTPFLHLSASFCSAMEALSYISENSVDIIFCDIQMPDLNGLEFSRMIGDKTKIIFTTAFSEYALEGFKVKAVDYLLKPIRYSDFLTAAQRALELISLERGSVQQDTLDAIYVKSDYQLKRVELSNLLYIEGLKDYVKIYVEGESRAIVSNLTMKSLEERLPESRFMRVHRSYIVNLSKAKVIERNRIIFGDEYIPISDNYKERFFAALSIY